MATHPALAPSWTSEPPSPPTPEPVTIRPKVMRRPAQFSAPIPVSTGPSAPVAPPKLRPGFRTLSAPILEVSVPAPISQFAPVWQEDTRFGLLMLVVVIAINAGLAWWLPQLHISPTSAVASSVTPLPTPASAAQIAPLANVTLYKKLPTPAQTPATPYAPTPALTDIPPLPPLAPAEPATPVHILGGAN